MIPSSPSGTKAELRRQLRERRRALAPEARHAAARALALRLFESTWFRHSRRIACYLPVDGEIDTALLIERVHRQARRRCYLPVLSHIHHDRLWFAPIGRAARYRDNRYGIPEPRVPARVLVRAQELDVILLPLVGFDAELNRLGMGGGFYDRSLEFLRHRHHWRKPRLVGLAYDFQKIERLPREAWDIALDAIVTDRAVYTHRNVSGETL